MSSPCNTMFSPVQFSMTVSNLSQMLIKRSLLSSWSSIQSPIHFWGTPFSMQHCSEIVCNPNRFSMAWFCHDVIQTGNNVTFCHCLPGQSLSLHSSVIFASPSHGAPPKSSSCSLYLVFTLKPSPQVVEHSPSLQSLHTQMTRKQSYLGIWHTYSKF